jgi:hypothetical protein
MTQFSKICPAAARLCAVFISMSPLLHGQAAGTQTETPAEPPKRASIGLRIQELPSDRFGIVGRKQYQTTVVNGKTAYDWQFNTTSRSPAVGVGMAFEYILGPRSTVSAEVLFHRLRYDEVTNVYSGTDDATTSLDERSRTTRTERTKARVWDVPVMLHYGGFRPKGIASRLSLGVGAAYRIVTNVRTENDYAYSDGTSAIDYSQTRPANRQTVGAVAGIGFRFVDEYNIKVTPEVRYTRWLRPVFSLDSTQSPKNQIEVGLGLTF